MTRSRRWLPLWTGLCLCLLGAGTQWLLWTGGPTLRPAGGIFSLLTYLGLVALCNRTRFTVQPDGVQLRRGPLPTGAGSEWIPRDQVAAGYWRWNYQGPKSGNVSHWESGIVHRDGRWLRNPAQFESEMQAAQETASMMGILGVRELGRVEGLPRALDRRMGRVTLVWMLLALAAFASAIVLEYRR